MVINRKGSRRITVRNETYIWRAKENEDYLLIMVQHEDERHQLLTASTESGALLNDNTPPITPSIIRKMIETALDKGWDPFKRTGKAITIAEIEIPEEWTFNGFWNIKSN